MASLWFWIVAAMIVAYLVLDGFDLGAGAIYLISARTNDERRRLLRAVGPVWDGNELWLIAIGATIYLAFPRLYAACFSGFCMLFTVVLGLLVVRGIGAELRRHIGTEQWQAFSDVVFCVSSILLVVLFGVVMGNVVRGVPLDSNGDFSLPLWTNFKLSSAVGIFDWYTVLIGALALITFTAHGAYYIALKTDGDLGRRARGFALLCWPVQFFLTICSMVATYFIQPDIMTNYQNHKIGVLVPIFIAASLVAMLWAKPKGKEKLAFIASSLYIAFMLAGAAFAVYPVMLPGRDHQYDLTIYNAGGGRGLSVGLAWCTFAVVLAIAGFVFVYRTFGGKVAGGEGQY